MSEKYAIESLIGHEEVITASELARRLAKVGVGPEAARKRISRIKGKGLWRSKNLRLPHNERLISHLSSRGTEKFFRLALNILREHRPGLVRCAEALRQKETLLIAEAGKLLAAPFDKAGRAKHPSAAQELFALEELGLAERTGQHTTLDRICRPGYAEATLAAAWNALSKLEIEHFMAEALCAHFRYMNFMTWGGVTTSTKINSSPIFYNYVVTAAGFSRLAAFRTEERKFIPFVVDVHRDRPTMADLEAFRERLRRIGFSAKSPVVGVFATEDFPLDVLKAAKGSGLLAINLNQLFGEAALSLMAEVENVLRAAKQPEAPPDFSELERLLSSLKTNPFLVQLRSLAFEAAVAYILYQRGWQSVQHALDVPFEKVTRDVDVYGYRNGTREAHIVECKAEISGKELDPGYVKKFYTETVPAYRRWHEERHGQLDRLVAEIWTTGVVGTAAEGELSSLKLKANTETRLLGSVDLHKDVSNQAILGLIEAVSAAPIARA